MKIRKATDTSDMRGNTTKDRVCEECKKIEVEGVYLTLGFFFGFLCTKCLFKLEDLLAIRFELPHVNTPIPTVLEGSSSEIYPSKPYNPPGVIDYGGDYSAVSLFDQPGDVEQITIGGGLNIQESAPTCDREDVIDILGDKVTQERYEKLIDREIALERILKDQGRERLEMAVAYITIKTFMENAVKDLECLQESLK